KASSRDCLLRLSVMFEGRPETELRIGVDGETVWSEEPGAVLAAEQLAANETFLRAEGGVVELVHIESNEGFVVVLFVLVSDASASDLELLVGVVIDRAGASRRFLRIDLLLSQHGKHVDVRLRKALGRGSDEIRSENDRGALGRQRSQIDDDVLVV